MSSSIRRVLLGTFFGLVLLTVAGVAATIVILQMEQRQDARNVQVQRPLLDTVRETGGRETGIPDSIASELTAREVEILLLLDDRLETDEIAKRLFISEHTVR